MATSWVNLAAYAGSTASTYPAPQGAMEVLSTPGLWDVPGQTIRPVQGPRLVIECVFCGGEKELSTSCSGCGSRRTDVRLAEVVV